MRELTQFKKGHSPWNKGTKGLTGVNSTSFKKGDKPHNTQPIGVITVRKDKEGRPYQYIKVGDKRWELYHRYVWEQSHGAIPKGYNVQFRDKNPLNCAIENLYIITKKEQILENYIHKYPTEVKQLIRQVSKLKKKVQQIKNNKDAKQD